MFVSRVFVRYSLLICLAVFSVTVFQGCIDSNTGDGSCCPTRIFGTVVSAQDGANLAGIEIRVEATGDSDITDAAGEFIMDVFHEGPSTITATDIDGAENGGSFAPASTTIDLMPGLEIQTDFSMNLE